MAVTGKFGFAVASLADVAQVGNAPTFARNSEATKRNGAGNILTVGSSAHRTGAFAKAAGLTVAGGYLGEGGTENKQAHSDDLTVGSYSPVRTTVALEGVIAPDGVGTSTAVRETSPESINFNLNLFQHPAVGEPSSVDYVVEMFVRPVNRSWVYWRTFAKDGVGLFSWYDITNGVMGTTAHTHAGIEDVGSGWMRVWARDNTKDGVAADVSGILGISNADGAQSYIGSTGAGIDAWGGSMKYEDVPTSYIDTSAGPPITRADDDMSIAHSGGTPFTIVAKARTAIAMNGVIQVLLEWHDGTTDNNIVIVRDTDDSLHVIVRDAGADVANLNMGAVADNTEFEIAVSGDDGDYAASLNGGALVTDAAGTGPVGMTTIEICQDSSNATPWNSFILELRVWNTQESDAFLQAPDAFSAGGQQKIGIKMGLSI